MSWLTLFVFLGACMAAATTGALFQPGEWYRRLDKPVWTPPDWLFPIAWTGLYIAMAVAAWRVAYAEAALVPLGLALWACQIALNTLWTPIFFGLRRLQAGLIVLSLLWIAVVATTIVFFAIDTLSGWLFLPYVVWVSYAGALNYSLLVRNPSEKPLLPGEIST
ncbi:tryptophan-rich sensory protein [Natronocella acetinitrilica]|uniref:Tryptophan-rich sensory protein n=1 Tax=Natronocella acetinitrilica TaxID=414046 RepID=A0AAE3G6T5_9GAMM|nr:TspO/MBR family protein [Natronocella acetinitrilica]MCP1675821.1 tryptophan-rich sensory protein [Natronocella acetinitrilica]